MNRTALDRFWSKVVKTDGCWIWRASTVGGYGQFFPDNHVRVKAHRFSYGLFVRELGPEEIIDHMCHDPAVCLGGECVHRRCVNPAHMRVTDRAGNSAVERTSNYELRKTHCPKGHPYNEENTNVYVRPNGKTTRQCLACRKIGNDRRSSERKLSRAKSM